MAIAWSHLAKRLDPTKRDEVWQKLHMEKMPEEREEPGTPPSATKQADAMRELMAIRQKAMEAKRHRALMKAEAKPAE